MAKYSTRPLELKVLGLRVRFGGLVAVDDVALTAQAGRITGLIGPNGAGKTSTFNACSGLVRPASGRVLLDGADVSSVGPAGRAYRGIGRTFQQVDLLETQSVRQNIEIGCEARLAGSGLRSRVFSTRRDAEFVAARANEAAALCGLGSFMEKEAGSLSTGQKRLVELARCLAGEYGVLLLDEPSSGLDRRETDEFAAVLEAVVRARGVAVLLVEHDMSLVMRVCQDIYVLDFGHLIFHGGPLDVGASPVVQSAYLGVEGVQS